MTVLIPLPSLELGGAARRRLAHALPRRRLEIGFGLFMLLAATRFPVSLIAPAA
jgi:hypothetical protein